MESLACPACKTQVSGDYTLPLLLQLSAEEQAFLLLFLKSSGSLKAMARQLGFSYPKVRNMLDELISTINQLENENKEE